MPARRILLLTQPAVIAVVALAFALAGLALLAARSVQRTRTAERRVEHAERTLAAVTRVKATVLEAGEAARSFVAARAAEDLAAFQDAERRHRDELSALVAQLETGGRPARPTEILALLVSERMQHLQAVVAAEATPSAFRLDALDHPAALLSLDHLRRRFTHLQHETRHELAAAAAAATHEAGRRDARLLAFVTATVTGTLAGTWIVLRRTRAVDRMVTVCAWTHRVKWQDQWISFEEYLARRYDQRCTHGICEEAAAEIRREIAKTPAPTIENDLPPPPPAGHVRTSAPHVAL